MNQLEVLADRALRTPRKTLLALDRLDCEENLLDFLRGCWPIITGGKVYVDGWHMEAIAAHLEAVTRGEIRRLVINIPPRMTKSSLVSVAWPAWVWAQPPQKLGAAPLSGPQVQFLTSSYAAGLSVRDSVRSRRVIMSPWYQTRWGDRFFLNSDQNAKGRYDNNLGGYRLATSTNGTLTGEGGDIIVVDDPHNTMEIESEAQREEALMWWDEAMSTRLNDVRTGAYVVVMQRLYENDITGHILTQNRGEWTHLMLPMEYEPRRHCSTSVPWVSPVTGEVEEFSDPREEEGELLCEERVPLPELNILKTKLGPFGTAGQLQQAPTPRGGAILKDEWWQAWPPIVETVEEKPQVRWSPELGRMVPMAPTVTFPTMEYVIASVDTAMTEKEENDFSAMTVWGLWFDKNQMPNLMLMDAWQERLALHDLVTKIIGICTRRQADRLLIEAKNNGFSVAQEVRRLTSGRNWSTHLEPVKGDKVSRAHACVPTFSAGQVWAPARNIDGNIVFFRWAQMVIDECVKFPRGTHDDVVDTVTQAVNHFRRAGLLQTRDDRRDEINRSQLPPAERNRRLVDGPLYGVM